LKIHHSTNSSKLKASIPLLYRAKEEMIYRKRRVEGKKFRFNREKNQLTIMHIVSHEYSFPSVPGVRHKDVQKKTFISSSHSSHAHLLPSKFISF